MHILYLADGQQITLPTKWEVCGHCDGEGKHVNSAVDGDGIAVDEFNSDPDFAESYFPGVYDVPCDVCNGRTTTQAVDLESMSDTHRELYTEQCEEWEKLEAETAAELRMGA